MASPRRTVSLVVVMVTMFQVIQACIEYKVGDSAGWTNVGHPDYERWAASKTFRLGDVIVFSYNPHLDNVLQVTYEDFGTCNTSAPIARYNSGCDSIELTDVDYFFLSGVPGHCQSGQKVVITLAD